MRPNETVISTDAPSTAPSARVERHGHSVPSAAVNGRNALNTGPFDVHRGVMVRQAHHERTPPNSLQPGPGLRDSPAFAGMTGRGRNDGRAGGVQNERRGEIMYLTLCEREKADESIAARGIRESG